MQLAANNFSAANQMICAEWRALPADDKESYNRQALTGDIAHGRNNVRCEHKHDSSTYAFHQLHNYCINYRSSFIGIHVHNIDNVFK